MWVDHKSSPGVRAGPRSRKQGCLKAHNSREGERDKCHNSWPGHHPTALAGFWQGSKREEPQGLERQPGQRIEHWLWGRNPRLPDLALALLCFAAWWNPFASQRLHFHPRTVNSLELPTRFMSSVFFLGQRVYDVQWIFKGTQGLVRNIGTEPSKRRTVSCLRIQRVNKLAGAVPTEINRWR